MNRPITPRDFVNGAAIVIAAAMLPFAGASATTDSTEP